jgi:carbonic anhydrase/acetyltransferase-like protein (isoleucine patch superfamily)
VPSIHPTAFIHPLAYVAGDVTLGARVSVWPTAVIRGDSDTITIGDDSNVQDGTVVHVDDGVPTTIGKRVAIGHRAIIHGSTVEDDCLIAMGAILLNGVRVGTGSIVGAGAMCPEGMQIPPNSLVIGLPARVVRSTTDAERDRIRKTVAAYVELQVQHRAGAFGQAGQVGQSGSRGAASPVASQDGASHPRESKQDHHGSVTKTSPSRP